MTSPSLYDYNILIGYVPMGEARRKKDRFSRIAKFAAWQIAQERPWYKPHLQGYSHFLMTQGTLSAISASTHLATIRASYRKALDNGTLKSALVEELALKHTDPHVLNTLVEETIAEIEQQINPEATRVEFNRPELAYIHLTPEQASMFTARPGVDTLAGLRDTALIALMLCMGLRATEISILRVEHLEAHLENGQPALYVPQTGKIAGRLVPYGDMRWVQRVTQAWLQRANIQDGSVIRGFYKNSLTIRNTGLKPHAIERLLATYPIEIGGQRVVVKPMDLRRTYARRLFEEGLDLETIMRFLNLRDGNAVLAYIGKDATQKRQHRFGSPIPMLYPFHPEI